MEPQHQRLALPAVGVRSILFVAMGLVILLGAGCGSADPTDQVTFSAQINEVDVSDSSPGDPITIGDDEPTVIELDITNVSSEPVVVRHVVVEGRVLDIVMLTYDTGIPIDVAPGATVSIRPIELDFFDLGGQITGRSRGSVNLYDDDRELLASNEVFFEAEADGFSTLESFNLVLLLMTLGGIAWNLGRLAQRQLPGNRLLRALRFAALGLGAGLTIATAFSTLSIWPLDTFAWALIAVIGAIACYVAGFVVPGSDDMMVDLLDEEDDLDSVLGSGA